MRRMKPLLHWSAATGYEWKWDHFTWRPLVRVERVAGRLLAASTCAGQEEAAEAAEAAAATTSGPLSPGGGTPFKLLKQAAKWIPLSISRCSMALMQVSQVGQVMPSRL